ncbi:MAG: histidine kinase dimerization/phospho-acceptor domain-containing protein [Pseudomonadota bacterium]
MDTVQSGILAFDSVGRVVTLNSAARHLLGGIADEPPFAWPEGVDFVDGESLTPIADDRSPIMQAIAGATLRNTVAVMHRANREALRYVRVSSTPVGRASSNLACVVVIDDISEQEKHRQQVERASRLDALGQLTGGIAHDFNNLLATIQYALQLAAGVDRSNRQQSYIETALNSVERGSELTRRLLSFAK